MENDRLRSLAYTLLTVAAVAAVCARICHAELVFDPGMYRAEGDKSPDAPPRDWPKTRPAPMPTFSSNDRSRWCAVRALVDEGTWVIGHRHNNGDGTYRDEGIVFENGWQTVDKVLDPEPRGDVQDYYSTKPPLLTVVAAGEYWLLRHVFGWTITGEPNLVVRIIVLTFNAAPLLLYLRMLRRLIERLGTSDWAKLFVFAAACFGTFVTTFETTLNNHAPAAVTALAAVYPLLARERLSLLDGLQCGFFAGLTVCLELPAAALAGILALTLVLRALRPPVDEAASFVRPDEAGNFVYGRMFLALCAALIPVSLELLLNHAEFGQWLPIYSQLDSPWYKYPGSHWLKPPPDTAKIGIDFARLRESRAEYWFHFLVGHHGLFSLTPIWLLSFIGMIRGLRQAGPNRLLFIIALPVSLVVVGFYLVTTDNYGGNTCCLRWLIWLSPLWLLAMLPALDRLADSTWGRRCAYALLAVSVFSATYPVWNPWRPPWIYELLDAYGFIKY